MDDLIVGDCDTQREEILSILEKRCLWTSVPCILVPLQDDLVRLPHELVVNLEVFCPDEIALVVFYFTHFHFQPHHKYISKFAGLRVYQGQTKFGNL